MIAPRPTRICNVCGHRLPIDSFGLGYRTTARSTTCEACATKRQQARPWTPAQNRRLVEAARGVVRCWAPLTDHMTESQRAAVRELVDAIDRNTGTKDEAA